MDTLRKDWLALSSAMFLGALLAHSWGYSIELGVLAGLLGGIFGYVFCLLTEPKCIWLAAFEAWRKTTEWRLKPDWKSRLARGADFGLGFGGPCAVMIGLMIMISEKWDALSEQIISYVFWSFLLSLLFVVLGIVLEYIDDRHDSRDAFPAWAVRNTNIVALHLHVVRLTLVAVNYLFFGLVFLAMNISKNTPAVIRGIPKFAKNFAIAVHSQKATAFGVYGSIGATAIYFLVPYSSIPLTIAAFIGGGIGVYARPLVLNWLQRSEAVS